MSPSEAFSTVANSFSVLGLADTVFKYGREVYETLVKIQHAPKQIKQLLEEIKDVEDHISRIRIFLGDLEQSLLPQNSKNVIPRSKRSSTAVKRSSPSFRSLPKKQPVLHQMAGLGSSAKALDGFGMKKRLGCPAAHWQG